MVLGRSSRCGFWCFTKFTICKNCSPPCEYRTNIPVAASWFNKSSTSTLSAGNISILIRFGRSSVRPSRSASVHRPINSSRASNGSSTNSSFLKNPGLMPRALAMCYPTNRACVMGTRTGLISIFVTLQGRGVSMRSSRLAATSPCTRAAIVDASIRTLCLSS